PPFGILIPVTPGTGAPVIGTWFIDTSFWDFDGYCCAPPRFYFRVAIFWREPRDLHVSCTIEGSSELPGSDFLEGASRPVGAGAVLAQVVFCNAQFQNLSF